jgi:hypothetical protein
MSLTTPPSVIQPISGSPLTSAEYRRQFDDAVRKLQDNVNQLLQWNPQLAPPPLLPPVPRSNLPTAPIPTTSFAVSPSPNLLPLPSAPPFAPDPNLAVISASPSASSTAIQNTPPPAQTRLPLSSEGCTNPGYWSDVIRESVMDLQSVQQQQQLRLQQEYQRQEQSVKRISAAPTPLGGPSTQPTTSLGSKMLSDPGALCPPDRRAEQQWPEPPNPRRTHPLVWHPSLKWKDLPVTDQQKLLQLSPDAANWRPSPTGPIPLTNPPLATPATSTAAVPTSAYSSAPPQRLGGAGPLDDYLRARNINPVTSANTTSVWFAPSVVDQPRLPANISAWNNDPAYRANWNYQTVHPVQQVPSPFDVSTLQRLQPVTSVPPPYGYRTDLSLAKQPVTLTWSPDRNQTTIEPLQPSSGTSSLAPPPPTQTGSPIYVIGQPGSEYLVTTTLPPGMDSQAMLQPAWTQPLILPHPPPPPAVAPVSFSTTFPFGQYAPSNTLANPYFTTSLPPQSSGVPWYNNPYNWTANPPSANAPWPR